MIGKTPKDMKINVATWKEAEEQFPDETEAAKTNYRNRLLEDIIDSFERKNAETVPYDLCTYLAHHCESLTMNGREFLKNNPNKRIPDSILRRLKSTLAYEIIYARVSREDGPLYFCLRTCREATINYSVYSTFLF